MDQGPQDPTSRCPVFGGSRFWRSRTDKRLCQRCSPHAMAALPVLAEPLNGESRVPRASPLTDYGDHVRLGPVG